MSQIPMPALAGVLIVTAWRMNEWETIKELFTNKYWSAVLLFILTMICTVIFDLSIAIVIGVIGGCVFLLSKRCYHDFIRNDRLAKNGAARNGKAE